MVNALAFQARFHQFEPDNSLHVLCKESMIYLLLLFICISSYLLYSTIKSVKELKIQVKELKENDEK